MTVPLHLAPREAHSSETSLRKGGVPPWVGFYLVFLLSTSVAHGLAPQDNYHQPYPTISRRQWARIVTASTTAVVVGNTSPTRAIDIVDHRWQEIADRLTHDLSVGATEQGSYVITGDLSRDLFRSDCEFSDPTSNVKSLNQYQSTLQSFLFDPTRSSAELVDPLVVVMAVDDPSSVTIRGRFRARGFLRFPWNPYVSAFESDIVYRIGTEDGLIYQQQQAWVDKSPTKALRETFTPSLFTPPPTPFLASDQPPSDEPALVTRLYRRVYDRRPSEYTILERAEIQSLVKEITRLQQDQPADSRLLPGEWRLVYLEGGGVDRRVPKWLYPEFAFNDQFQIFGSDGTIDNVGQLWGPGVLIRVSGTYQQLEDPTTAWIGEATSIQGGVDQSATDTSLSTVRRSLFQAEIVNGTLCAGEASSKDRASCVGLPISGVGVFESLYLGQRLRILKTIDETGTVAIQVRMTPLPQ